MYLKFFLHWVCSNIHFVIKCYFKILKNKLCFIIKSEDEGINRKEREELSLFVTII